MHRNKACATRSVEKEIRKQDPRAIVVQKDIREFMDPPGRMLDEKILLVCYKKLTHSIRQFISLDARAGE